MARIPAVADRINSSVSKANAGLQRILLGKDTSSMWNPGQDGWAVFP